jgi:transposase
MARPAPEREKIEAVEHELARGATLDEAAARVGVSRRTVARWLQRGWAVRRQLHPVEDDEPRVDPATLSDDELEEQLLAVIYRAATEKHDWRAAKLLLEAKAGRWP